MFTLSRVLHPVLEICVQLVGGSPPPVAGGAPSARGPAAGADFWANKAVKGLVTSDGEASGTDEADMATARSTLQARKRSVLFFGRVFFLITLGSPHVLRAPCGPSTRAESQTKSS